MHIALQVTLLSFRYGCHAKTEGEVAVDDTSYSGHNKIYAACLRQIEHQHYVEQVAFDVVELARKQWSQQLQQNEVSDRI
jgi:hypothetical protein